MPYLVLGAQQSKANSRIDRPNVAVHMACPWICAHATLLIEDHNAVIAGTAVGRMGGMTTMTAVKAGITVGSGRNGHDGSSELSDSSGKNGRNDHENSTQGMKAVRAPIKERKLPCVQTSNSGSFVYWCMMRACARRCEGRAGDGVAGAACRAEGPGPLGARFVTRAHPPGSRTGGALLCSS